ncbi:MAG TPA: response regulator, partial [Planctomycetota bacterium]|nr:response regulator [Planctomycetota bacterium]
MTRRTLLVVEDEVDIRAALAAFLESEGFEVLTAGDGREALEVLSGARPAAVVTDLMMPGMNGSELCRALAASAALRSIPVILMTAAPLPDGPDCPCAACLRKPFEIEDLLRAIALAVRPG